MEVMGQLHAQADLAQSSSPCTHRIGGLWGSGAGVENLEMKKKIPCHSLESKVLHFSSP